MKKQDVKKDKKVKLDLDAALEEVAKSLRPTANKQEEQGVTWDTCCEPSGTHCC